ncbi:MAG: colicin transporter, partial [Alphaproteobacteria bacterium]|nr:colicin transporter [Alphaproteobacteria bacterium]
MIAVKRLQSLIWVLLVALGALGAYLVSLKVATERNELMQVRMQIARAKGDIRYLETEFSARASMRQLESWNQHDF